MDLFVPAEQAAAAMHAPLATRMRPRSLDEFVGQAHFVGPGKLLRRALDAGRLSSAIFFGPPGTGKTTLAQLIAKHARAAFETVNATAAGVKELRELIDRARVRLGTARERTVVFVDEIHRFSRAQQDVLLPVVEDGTMVLLGATTENAFFAVNGPLVSRSQVFQFEPLSDEDVLTLLRRALSDCERGLGQLRPVADEAALEFFARRSDGDARRALNALEIAVLSQVSAAGPGPGPHVSLAVAEDSMQLKALNYDGTGDEHYDLASAFIKSMRGSDPDATTYWLARMLVAGEDPRFVARRIAILASEDIGNADPIAIQVAAACFDIVEKIGLPEAQLTLAQAAIYMACAPKSNASAQAIWQASADVRQERTQPVPRHLRDSKYAGAQRLGHRGYVNPHTDPEGAMKSELLGADKRYYEPTTAGAERVIAERLKRWRQQRAAATSSTATRSSFEPGRPEHEDLSVPDGQ